MRKILATGLVLGLIAGFLIGNVRAEAARSPPGQSAQQIACEQRIAAVLRACGLR